MKDIAVVLIFVLIGLNIWSHSTNQLLDVLAAYFNWTMKGRAVVDVVISIGASMGGALAMVTNTQAVIRGWLISLNLAAPNNAEKIDAATAQAKARDVSVTAIADARAASADRLVDKIATLPTEPKP